MSDHDPQEQVPFSKLVRVLAADRGWSLERLATESARPDERISHGLVRKVLDGRRTLTEPVLVAIADALTVPADTFIEYRLAQARAKFDERQLGLDQAAANLDRLNELWPTPPGEART